jgi:signal transduction histidine kinase
MTILGFSELIMNTRYEKYAEHINFCANHLLRITTTMLDIAKIEAGAEELVEKIVDLDALMTSATRLVAPLFQQKGAALSYATPPRSIRARLDEQRTRQVLVNLLTNAAKFTPSGGSVRTEIVLGAGGEITMTVHDTGMGIAPEDIDNVVVPFGRQKIARTSHIEGTGLGLALSKAIVEAHGGRLVIASRVGLGTSVSVHLPGDRSVDAANLTFASAPLPWVEPLPPVDPALFRSASLKARANVPLRISPKRGG